MYLVALMVLAGETLLEVQQRLLREREVRIRTALEKLRRKRHLLRTQRKHKDFPIVSVLGYTNCGEWGGGAVCLIQGFFSVNNCCNFFFS